MNGKFFGRLQRGVGLATAALGLVAGACSSETASVADAEGVGAAAAAASGGSATQAGASSAGMLASGATSAAGLSQNGGTESTAGSGGSANGSAGAGGGVAAAGCDTPGLVWKTARKTWYTSYPDPGSPECIEYNGCTWAGQFAACDEKKPVAWVAAHNIVAAFPDFDALSLHDLCLRSGNKRIVVTVLDTCADSDCAGCCTQNQGSADGLIDLESYTNERWGVEDGQIEWADLGPTTGAGCAG